jgi:serine/threonine protein kinase
MAGQLHVKFGKTFRYQASCDSLLGRGGCGMVFVGDFKRNLYKSWKDCSNEGEKAAIKRVEINFKRDNWMDIGNDREVFALKELRHPCIVSLLAVEDDDNFR